MGNSAVTGSAGVGFGDPVPSRPHVTVKPVRLRGWSEDLHTNLSRTIGYRAVCRCEWRGKIRRVRSDAFVDAREHDHHA